MFIVQSYPLAIAMFLFYFIGLAVLILSKLNS